MYFINPTILLRTSLRVSAPLSCQILNGPFSEPLQKSAPIRSQVVLYLTIDKLPNPAPINITPQPDTTPAASISKNATIGAICNRYTGNPIFLRMIILLAAATWEPCMRRLAICTNDAPTMDTDSVFDVIPPSEFVRWVSSRWV